MNLRTLSSCAGIVLLSSCENSYGGSTTSYFWYILAGIAALFVIYRWTKHEPEKELDAIHAHQYHHFEDFQLSSAEFYTALKEIITERSFPHVKANVVKVSTGGLLSHNREYLEVTASSLAFYVCAAPFGKNFFISYWLRELPPGCVDVFNFRVFGYTERKTFYQVDTEAMFVEGIKAAIQKAIAKVTEAKGLRTLTPFELTPKRA
jgi:hypothetical protein